LPPHLRIYLGANHVSSMRPKILLSAVAALTLPLAACNQEAKAPAATAAAQTESPFRLTATIQELMDAEVDPAADFIWGSVGFIANKNGVQDKTPKTDKDWAVVRNNAIILTEAANLLVIPGRQVAREGLPLDVEEKGGIEDPKEIQKAIEAKRDAFLGFAHRLHDVGAEILSAIDKKDIATMDALGEKLDAACEQCHRTFWYPNAV
jgi:hypothetical protein